jgi:hypothetical protein
MMHPTTSGGLGPFPRTGCFRKAMEASRKPSTPIKREDGPPRRPRRSKPAVSACEKVRRGQVSTFGSAARKDFTLLQCFSKEASSSSDRR